MEVLIVILGLWGVIALYRAMSSAGDPQTTPAPSMGPFTTRLRDSRKEAGSEGEFLIKEVEGRGLIPIDRPADVAFVTSVFDKTSGNLVPVISAIEAFQEIDNVVFQHRVELGRVGPSQGFVEFARIGAVIPDILVPPYSGWRTLTVISRLIDVKNPPDITHGLHEPDHAGLLWSGQREFKWNFLEAGYEEKADNRDEAIRLVVEVGVAVAMADGSMADVEGECLKRWIERTIEPFGSQKREELKDACNKSLKTAYQKNREGTFKLSDVTARLREVADMTAKYEAVELAYDIVSADGVADRDELLTVREIAESLNLNMDSVTQMRDKTLLSVQAELDGQAGIEDILGIDPNWDKQEIQRHLRSEFQKWNDRLNNLPEGAQRENAQRMLDMISKARKKYG